MLHKSEEKKVWALQKYLSEWCIKGDHLLKKLSWSDQCLHFYGWFSGWCFKENVNFGLICKGRNIKNGRSRLYVFRLMTLFTCQNLDIYISASGTLFKIMLHWHTIQIELTMLNTLYVYNYLWTSVRDFISNGMLHFFV